jgi:hypothetical protein
MSVKAGENFLLGGQTAHIVDREKFVSNLAPLITKYLLLTAKESRI